MQSVGISWVLIKISEVPSYDDLHGEVQRVLQQAKDWSNKLFDLLGASTRSCSQKPIAVWGSVQQLLQPSSLCQSAMLVHLHGTAEAKK